MAIFRDANKQAQMLLPFQLWQRGNGTSSPLRKYEQARLIGGRRCPFGVAEIPAPFLFSVLRLSRLHSFHLHCLDHLLRPSFKSLEEVTHSFSGRAAQLPAIRDHSSSTPSLHHRRMMLSSALVLALGLASVGASLLPLSPDERGSVSTEPTTVDRH